MFDPIFKKNVQGGNIQWVVHLQNQNYLCKERLKCRSKGNYGHKNPNDSHNYHDENHDEIEFNLENSDRSTQWHSTLDQRTHKKNESYRLNGDGVLLTNVNFHL